MCNKIGLAANRIVMFIIIIIIIILSVAISSCVVVPYEPSPEVSISGSSDSPTREIVVSASPRELLEQLSEVITEAEMRIEIVDPITFIEVAFPSWDKGLLRLFEDGNSQRISYAPRLSSELGVDYLVLIGDMEEETLSEVGAMGWFIVFFGVVSGEIETRLSAIIIDIKNERLLHDVTSSARGSYGAIGYAYLVGTGPDTESSAIKGLGHKIADIISNDSANEIIRIAVLQGRQSPAVQLSDETLRALIQMHEANATEVDAWVLMELYWRLHLTETQAAHRWLCRAADQGSTDASYQLGVLYRYGIDGLPVDHARSYLWYSLAAQGDYHRAKVQRQALLSEISADQLEKGKALLDSWQPGQCERDVTEWALSVGHE